MKSPLRYSNLYGLVVVDIQISFFDEVHAVESVFSPKKPIEFSDDVVVVPVLILSLNEMEFVVEVQRSALNVPWANWTLNSNKVFGIHNLC